MSALLLTVTLFPLGGADDSNAWVQTDRISMFSEEPVKSNLGCSPIETPLCGQAQRNFGAELSFDGETAVIGEPNEETVYVYERDGLNWEEAASFTGPNGFGSVIAVHEGMFVVGVYQESTVYIYERTSDAWEEVGEVPVTDSDCPGRAIDLDAAWLLVGDPCASKVHLFERLEEGAWGQQQVLEGDASDFGRSISIGDGEVAVQSSEGAYILSLEDEDWNLDLVAPGLSSMVALSGNTLAVHFALGVHLFEKTEGDWIQTQSVSPEDASSSPGADRFGRPIALSGSTLVVGATNADSWPGEAPGEGQCVSESGIRACVPPLTGAAYVFEQVDGEWRQTKKLVAEVVGDHRFGSAVGISADEDTIMVGAPARLVLDLLGAGQIDPENAVHVFERITGGV